MVTDIHVKVGNNLDIITDVTMIEILEFSNEICYIESVCKVKKGT